ncbi:transporter substrate-binding domain-containing protein [Pseudomonas gingeri]|uniref:transporter substrate-binding domain-containing protein n=1 Tax=Pseudomonas gingeri TaxID=117681 RepID=UPI0015A1992B|nr:transporter substrate-binding domain-containing protein [Pseudomonas gingeri]NWA29460.1 transporter substrate-binding domain-containing protein [Pseudomonas gingeri]
MRFLPGLLLLLPFASPFAQAELIDDVNDRGELRIALEGDMRPFGFNEDGHLTGFEVELGEQLAKELDVQASFVPTDATDLLQGVETGKYDVAINHMAMTAELQKRYDFSEPYSYPSAQLIVHKEVSPTQIPLAMRESPLPLTADTVEGATVTLVIPFQKGNPAFQASLDKALQRLKADGRLAALSQKWFGKDTTQPPKP